MGVTSTNKTAFEYADASVTSTVGGSILVGGTWSLLSGVALRTSSTTVYLNGTSDATTATVSATTLTNSANLYIGTNTGDAGYWLSDVGEILVFSSTLATSDRQQVEGYLAWKWGLQGSLPSTHPYNNIYSSVRPFLRPFQPIDVSTSCLLWFDGADATTLSLTGTTVNSWNDKSSNANNISTFTTTKPTYNSSTGLLTFSGGTGATSSVVNVTSASAWTAFFAVVLSSGYTDTGTLQYFRPLSHASPTWFASISRSAYSTTVTGASISGSNTVYTMASTASFTAGNTVTISGITLGSATGYNGTGTVQSVSTNVSVTVNITSTGTPTSYTGAIMFRSGGASVVSFNAETNSGSGPFATLGSSLTYNSLGGDTFIFAMSQTSATPSYVLTANGTAPSLSSPTATATFTSGKNLTVGSISGGLSHQIGEILFYDGTLSTQDRQRVEGYLIWKWGAQRTSYPGASTNMVSTHPFYKFPIATTTPFDPRILGNLYMWYDGADTTTITGSPMTAWTDKSGNSNNLTASSSYGPTRTAVSTNPVGYDIVFNGSSNYMWSTSLGTAISSTAFTYFTVFINNDPSTGYGRIVSAGTTSDNSSGDTSGLFISNDGATTSAPFKLYSGKATAVVNQPLTKGTYHIVSLVFTSTPSATAFYDGTQVGTFTPASEKFNFTKFSLGRHINTGNPLNGVINESIAFTTALTAVQRQQVEGYLAWKWGLQNSLPSFHPYYKIRP
jgi:hypothetical protein